MPQKDTLGLRSDEDGAKFGRAIKQMGSLYASMAATAVLQLQNMADPNDRQHSTLKTEFESVLVIQIAQGGWLAHPDLAERTLRALAGTPSAVLSYWATIELPMENEKAAMAAVEALEAADLPGGVTPRRDGSKIFFDVRRCFLELIQALLSRQVGCTALRRLLDMYLQSSPLLTVPSHFARRLALDKS